MSRHASPALPGAELAAKGERDIARGEASIEALLASRFATRLAQAGRPLPAPPLADADRRLYVLLGERDANGAHSSFNALTRRFVSYLRAVERATGR